MSHQKNTSQDQTIITPGATMALPIMESSPYLVVLFPTEMYRSFALPRQAVRVGRSKDCEISIPDNLLSRQHCEIYWDGKTIWLRDLNSTNGTFVDGSPVNSKVELNSDSRLMIGQLVLKVEFKEPSEIEREKALYAAATTDALTHIPNRRFFLEQAQGELARAKRQEYDLHSILIEIDFFKKVNDTYGHPEGDFVLREVAAIFDRERREEDLLARFGGEEFIFLLSNITAKHAQAFSERLRLAVQNHRFVWKEQRIPLTISLGLASATAKSVESLDKLFALADSLLYQAKRDGRNRVCS